MADRPLTEQMRRYLAAVYFGGFLGFACGFNYNGTRKGLVKRGLLRRERDLTRAGYVLTDAGAKVAASLPDPRRTARGEPTQGRLAAVKAGRW